MDPLSVAGIVGSSLGLAFQFGTAAKGLGDIAGRYKNAKLTVKALAQNLDILQLIWTQIGQWFESYAGDESLCDIELVKRVTGFLETGTLVMEALKQDLLAYDVENPNFTQRSKLIWKENTLESHQIRIRDQVLSMNLFLQAVKLPTSRAQIKLLHESEDQFRKSNKSAYSIDSIVSSELTSPTSQRRSLENSNRGSLGYRPLSFENILFMSKVYMRNSKNMMIKKIFRSRKQPMNKMTEMMQPVPNWEAIRDELDVESLLLSTEDVSTDNDATGYLLRPDKSPTPFFEQLLLGIANYINKYIAPWDIQTLTPIKLATFYHLVGGDLDPFFLDTPQASLSSVYQILGCYHTLQPDGSPYTPPSLPALTPACFVRWQTIQLLLEPEYHVPFLQEAVKRFNITDPVNGASFPNTLPRECLPHQPDLETVEWHKTIAEKLRSEVEPGDLDLLEDQSFLQAFIEARGPHLTPS